VTTLVWASSRSLARRAAITAPAVLGAGALGLFLPLCVGLTDGGFYGRASTPLAVAFGAIAGLAVLTNAAARPSVGALAMLALLQREGRLVDFLRDSVDGADDADIGAAAREVHRGCRKVLDQVLTIEPVMPGAEEARVSVPKGFDPAEIRLIGEARGDAPYQGTLRHHGWRVVDAKLPTLTDGVDRTILAPAEVEL
jgi:hypothetical protein